VPQYAPQSVIIARKAKSRQAVVAFRVGLSNYVRPNYRQKGEITMKEITMTVWPEKDGATMRLRLWDASFSNIDSEVGFTGSWDLAANALPFLHTQLDELFRTLRNEYEKPF
jgi:hypothetical protein